jgi:type II secretory pathway pseudopilin PulG
MDRRVGRERAVEAGVSLLELLLVTTLVATIAGVAVPFTARGADALKARQAAGFFAAQVRTVRQRAVTGNRATALVFDQVDGVWVYRICADGNHNGVRRADIAAGRDPCAPPFWAVSQMHPGVRLALDPHVPGIDEPAGRSDGVRFGTASMVSCSAVGHCSSGTLYVRSARGRQLAVRVAGVTGRVRVLKFDSYSGRWTG